MITFKGINFVIRLVNESRESFFYKINYFNNRCKKENIKENKVKSLAYLKKKIIKKNKYFASLYYILISGFFIFISLFCIFRKKFIFIIALAVLALIIYFLTLMIRKNAYRFFSKGEK
jgi:hypothetical protein